MSLRELDQIGCSEGGALGKGQHAVKGPFDLDVCVELDQSAVHAFGGVNVVVLVVGIRGREESLDFGRDRTREGALSEVKGMVVIHLIPNRRCVGE